jgi:hypothetical protein
VVDDRILLVYVWRDAAEEASDPDADVDPVVAFVDVEPVADFVDDAVDADFVDVAVVADFVEVVPVVGLPVWPVVTFALVSTHEI